MLVQLNNWLWQGDINSVKNKEFCGKDIKGIVFLGENNDRVFPDYSDNVAYLWCPFNDPGENLSVRKVEAIVGFSSDIKSEGAVLIACFGGVNRSSAMCAIVLHYIDNLKDKDACDLVRKKNTSINIRKELTIRIKNILGQHIA